MLMRNQRWINAAIEPDGKITPPSLQHLSIKSEPRNECKQGHRLTQKSVQGLSGQEFQSSTVYSEFLLLDYIISTTV